MTRLHPSRWLCSALWLLGFSCWLGCGGELPMQAGPPPIPVGPARTQINPNASASSAGMAGDVSVLVSGRLATGAAAGGGGDPSDSQGLDAGVAPLGAGAGAALGGSAGFLGTAGQSGMTGAGRGGTAGSSGRAGAGGASGAAGAEDQACRDVFCFTPIECLFFTVPCGFTECDNFTCK
jgi:hypothetical protein